MNVKRLHLSLKNDVRRVLLRPFYPTTEERTGKILQRILALNEKVAQDELRRILDRFEERHRDLKSFYLKRFEDLRKYLDSEHELTEQRKMLIGAYFSLEYSLEASALFNPSLIWHPDQAGLPAGTRRFLISLRATGEGHISSLVFRSGTVDKRLPDYNG